MNGSEPVVITGAAGFIGFHLARHLLEAGRPVVGIDNLSPFYAVDLKRARLRQLSDHADFRFEEVDLVDRPALDRVVDRASPREVIHLAAQAGVRHSIDHPEPYVQSNLVGFANVLECVRRVRPAHFIFASTSSVYGLRTDLPLSPHGGADHPLSLYAATKRSNELMAHAYAHLFGIAATGLRFFTVYGPWGRPDMAYFSFADAIREGRPVTLYDGGDLQRDFTYIDDVVTAVAGLIAKPAEPDPAWRAAAPDPATSRVPFRLFNVGNSTPVRVERLVDLLETFIGRRADRRTVPAPASEVKATSADCGDLSRLIGFRPDTALEVGLKRFVEWHRLYRDGSV